MVLQKILKLGIGYLELDFKPFIAKVAKFLLDLRRLKSYN